MWQRYSTTKKEESSKIKNKQDDSIVCLYSKKEKKKKKAFPWNKKQSPNKQEIGKKLNNNTNANS